ncbi:hypothetical protein BU17DRAFT_85253 [Hysterangium stoloniferum]|nr:hypothetical protein BU17DRAFT_85253 [Hysterangium stoloniferum]
MSAQVPLDVTNVLSVWFEVFLYGLYCTLFVQSLDITLKRQRTKTVPAKVFFISTIVLFIVATSHIALNLYRLLRGYVWLAEDPGPVLYFNDLGRWENIAHDAINAVMTWLGDMLLIYRCFIIWNNSYYIIGLPTLLLIMSIVTNSVALRLFTEVRLGTLFSPSLVAWMNSIYAIALAQNFITTALIAYRLWRQDNVSIKAGLRDARPKSSLRPIIRIVIESAAIYVLTVIVIIIMYARGNNLQFVAQEAIVPIIGIVFTLISVRLAMHSTKMLATTVPPARTLTDWQAAPHRHSFLATSGDTPGTLSLASGTDSTINPSGFTIRKESMYDDSGSGDEEKGRLSSPNPL